MTEGLVVRTRRETEMRVRDEKEAFNMSTDDENTPQRDIFRTNTPSPEEPIDIQVKEKRRRRKKGNDYCHVILRAGATRRSCFLWHSHERDSDDQS